MRAGLVIPFLDAGEVVEAAELAEVVAAATWWIESDWSLPTDGSGLDALHRRITAGPPTGPAG